MKKRDKERVYCEKLRRAGKSYTEIQDACVEKFDYKPSKGMCNNWLADLELTEQQVKAMAKRIEARTSLGSHKGGAAQKRKKQERIAKIKASIDYEFEPNELKSVGLAMYWGEGYKHSDHSVAVSNSDPYVHRLFLVWLEECYGIKKSELKFHLHTHKGADVEGNIDFWCEELGVSRKQFTKPYVRDKCNPNHRKSKTYKGTLDSRLHKTELHRQIMFEIDEIKKNFPGK